MVEGEESVTTRLSRGLVDGFHGLVKQRELRPVGPVLEPRRVQDQDRIRLLVVGRQRRKVAVPGLLQHLPAVRNHEALELLPRPVFATVTVTAAGDPVILDAGSRDGRSKVFQAGALVAVPDLDGQALAEREALEVRKGDARLLDRFQVDAAVEHLLFVPPPRTLPLLTGIDRQGVQDQDEGADPAKGRLGLGVVLFDEVVKGLETPALQGAPEDLLSTGGGESHAGFRELALVEGRDPGRVRRRRRRRCRYRRSGAVSTDRIGARRFNVVFAVSGSLLLLGLLAMAAMHSA
mmetsp:Transcript_18552/g.42844  ORF Transcript_18552/g.42844 Transcript_18552/m.42844 type:complete len:292 (-) Transcript_18552:483-1358(-)